MHDLSADTVIASVTALALFLLAFLGRRMALTVQTRLIRLEMRLRMRELLPADLRGRIEEFQVGQLVALGREFGVPVMEDQGSGAILDPVSLGLRSRHGSLPQSVKAGYDLITASGDKLLGGTQAGILLGRREFIDRAMAHPLARSLRIDKLTLAGLEATLRLYRDPAKAMAAIPTLRYLTRSEEDIRRMAVRLRTGLTRALPQDRFAVSLVKENSYAGGGSLPADALPTTCIAIRTLNGGDSVDHLAKAFRLAKPSVFGRIREDAYLLDPRTLEGFEIDMIVKVCRELSF